MKIKITKEKDNIIYINELKFIGIDENTGANEYLEISKKTYSYPILKKGVVGIKNYSDGYIQLAHPDIDITGSIKGMKNKKYWEKDDKIIQVFNRKVNVSKTIINNIIDEFILKMELNYNFYETILLKLSNIENFDSVEINIEKEEIIDRKYKNKKGLKC